MSEITNALTVTLRVVEGTLFAAPNDGHLRARQKSVLRWRCEQPFTLEFNALGEGFELWPFVESPPSGPKTEFTLTLKPLAPHAKAPYYKYTVKAGRKVLDPIIIVDD